MRVIRVNLRNLRLFERVISGSGTRFRVICGSGTRFRAIRGSCPALKQPATLNGVALDFLLLRLTKKKASARIVLGRDFEN
jgi:hypothetical protein